MPKFPPPPLSAQNRSRWFVSLARTSSPAAVTTSADRRLSQVSPYLGLNHPTPPPSVRPATPILGSCPPGTANPNLCVSWSMSPQVAPASTRAVAASGSTRTPFIRERSIISPSSQTALPETWCPPPFTDNGRSFIRATSTAAITSAAPDARRIPVGSRSILAFQTCRASSYPSSPWIRTSPRTRSCRLLSGIVVSCSSSVIVRKLWAG